MSHLQTYGRRLLDAGYDIVPLQPGQKHPNLKNWTKLDPREEIDNWLDGPMRDWGVGIRTRHNPAIDIDCDDPDIVRAVYAEIARIAGPCRTYRIGRAPRILLIFRTDEPFSKLRSAKYEHTLLSTTHQVEILADGQQFAAYHVHPGTGKDYAWPVVGPADAVSDALPVLSLAQAQQVIEAFERLAQDKVRAGEWNPVSGSTALATTGNTEEWLLAHTSAKARSVEEIREALEVLSSADYDRWLQVGMILHHQFSGEYEGYELWDEWSKANGGEYAGPADTLYRWNGFKSDTKSATVTIGSLFHWATEARHAQAGNALAEIEKLIASCNDFTDLLGGNTARACRDWLDLYPLFRDRVVDLVKRRAKLLCGSPVSVETVRRALKSSKKPVERDEATEMYPWAEPYVYLADEDKFFNLDARVSWSRAAFDAAYDRLLSDDPDDTVSAARTALREAKIPHVQGARYLPGAEPLFQLGRHRYANTYDPDDGAVVPDELSAADLRARALFAQHVKLLIPNEQDRRVFIDYLTYVVQNPGKKVNYAILMQGQEGDGKSFFAEMMGLILGPSNVHIIGGAQLEEQWTSWAEGSQICFMEEVKLHGVSGHSILNRFKPYVTNKTVVIRRMRTDPYSTPNVTSYVLFTNFQDALPLDRMDSRYYVIFSRWNSREELLEWLDNNEGYFDNLYGAVQAAPGSLKKWFLEREISPDFKPDARAPDSVSKKAMAQLARDEQAIHIDDILDTLGKGEYGKNTELLSSTWLMWNWGFDGSQIQRPAARKLNSLMLRDGWKQVRFVTESGAETERISVNHRNHRFWTKDYRACIRAQISDQISLRLSGTYGETLE